MPLFELKPRIYVSLKDLPEAREWKVGETYKVNAKIKQIMIDDDEASFEVVDIRPVGNSSSHNSGRKNKKKMNSEGGIMYS